MMLKRKIRVGEKLVKELLISLLLRQILLFFSLNRLSEVLWTK